MQTNQILEEGILKINISGELDASSAIDMDDVMKDAFQKGHFLILINCSDLKYISSAGLGVFVSYLEDFKSRNGKFVFYRMNESVFSVFQILGLDKIMTIVKDEQEAKKVVNEK